MPKRALSTTTARTISGKLARMTSPMAARMTARMTARPSARMLDAAPGGAARPVFDPATDPAPQPAPAAAAVTGGAAVTGAAGQGGARQGRGSPGRGRQVRGARMAAGAVALALLTSLAPGAPAAAADLGDAQNGAKLWRKCKGCHMIGEGARNRVGPHLNGLFGRRAAALDGYKYSADMMRAGADGLTWTPETLDVYIDNPKALVTGTRMAFRGIKDQQDRHDLVAYLRSFSASPADIPESAPTAAPRDPDVDPAILAIQGDPAYGEYLSSECTTCHQADGSDRGIPSIVGWPAADFVTVMHAYKNEHRPHPVMRMMAQRLSDEEIAGLAAYFGGL